MSLKDKEVINMEEKKTIAKYAASLILPGDYIFIDSGSTIEYMINYLTEKKATKKGGHREYTGRTALYSGGS